MVLLPGDLPPDQLIFEYLYNLPADHNYWKNDLQFTRDVFTNSAWEVIRTFSISGCTVDVKERLANYHDSKKPREIFKQFYKNSEFQRLVTSGSKPYNPWRLWVANNPKPCNVFLSSFKAAIHAVMKDGYFVDVAKLETLVIKRKKES